MNILIISGVAIGVFLLSLLLSKNPKLPADKFLIAYLVFFVASQVYVLIEYAGALNTSFLMLFGKGHYLLGAPLFFYYVYVLTGKKSPNITLYALTLLPFFVYEFAVYYYYQWGFAGNDIHIKSGLLYINNKLSLVWSGFVGLFMLTDPFYLGWFYLLLRKYKKNVLDSISNADVINLNWLSLLFYVWAVSALVLFPISVLTVGRDWMPVSLTHALLQISNVVFIFIVGYYGFKQTTVFANSRHQIEVAPKKNPYQRSGLTKLHSADIHSQLLNLMTERRPYLNGDLTASELAEQLGVSANHLSQVLNQEQHQNFFDFVNSYRVREVQRKMKDSAFDHYTLLAIALDSGFNSKTSFNTVFKKLTASTPSQYFKELKATRAISAQK